MLYRKGSRLILTAFFVCLTWVLCLDAGETDTVFRFPVTPGGGNVSFERVGERLRAARLIRARFQQKKTIKALRRPLESEGSFLFAGGVGLYWKTETPFETVFVMTHLGIRQLEEGRQTLKINAEDQPVIHGFTKIFLDLFQGDAQELQQSFDLFFKGDLESWTMGLRPRGKILGRLIDRIVLRGGETITSVDFVETTGDLTLISFSKVTHQPPELTEEERRYFEE